MAKTHHIAHHGYRQPEPSMQHARKHDTQIAAIDRDHAARNNGGGSMGTKANMSQPAGGSSAIHDPGPKGKDRGMTGDTAIKGIKKLAAGRMDNASVAKNTE